MPRSIDTHKPACACPACTYRRRPIDGSRDARGRTPLRPIRLNDDLWGWLKSQPGGAAKTVERLVRQAMKIEN